MSNNDYIIRYGKFKGKKVKDVPIQLLQNYLSWLESSDGPKKGTNMYYEGNRIAAAVNASKEISNEQN